MTARQLRLFDAHLHIIDPRFPLIANHGYRPPPFPCNEYLQRLRGCELLGGAVVSGSFQGFDQSYLLDALARLGEGFVGVTQLPATVSDRRLRELDAAGVRAVRFNLKRGGSEDLRHLQQMAQRVHDLVDWRVELYVDAHDLRDIWTTVIALPAVSIDHLGLSAAGLPLLLKLVEHGVRVKASGFGRVDFEVSEVLRQVHAVNPRALMFGTDLPSTRAARPYRDSDLDLVIEALGPAAARAVFAENAQAWYRPRTFRLGACA